MLGLRDKAAIASGMARFLRGYPTSDAESFAAWLERTRQTGLAIRHFWEPMQYSRRVAILGCLRGRAAS